MPDPTLVLILMLLVSLLTTAITHRKRHESDMRFIGGMLRGYTSPTRNKHE